MSAKIVFIAATILSLAASAAGAAAVLPDRAPVEAQSPGRHGARVYGTIEAIKDGTLTVATPTGPATLIVDSNTLFHVPDIEQAALDDLSIGDAVGAAGWWEKDASIFHAFVVAKLAGDRAFTLAGELIAIDGQTLTLETRRGSATVQVNEETTYHIKGIEKAGLDDLEVGLKIAARGTLQADGSLLATSIGAKEPGPREGRLRGEIVAIDGDTLTVRAKQGQIVVLTDETTEFRVPDVKGATIADLDVGDKVAGTGTVEESSTGERVVKATLVVVLPDQVAKLTGKVSAIEGTTLVLDAATGQVDVLTGDHTVFHIRGIEQPSLADVAVGDRITAAGTWKDETTFDAIGVGVAGGQRAGERGSVRGRAIDVGQDSLVVGTSRGPVTVRVDEQTQFRLAGEKEGSLDDIEPGAMVGARGTWNEAGSLQATGVGTVGEGERPARKK